VNPSSPRRQNTRGEKLNRMRTQDDNFSFMENNKISSRFGGIQMYNLHMVR
jgi:hypothetical protein